MAKKKIEMNYGQLSVAELGQHADKAREELFKARFRMASSASSNTMQIRTLRREIARLQTYMNQRSQKS